MATRRLRAVLMIALLLAPLAILAAACSRPDEQQFLTQFFRAARGRDNTTLAMMSAVAFSPREQGSVDDFEITQISEERRTPLDFKSLVEAERKATQDDEEFRKRKIEYQNANLPALETIVKLERDPTAKMTPAQLKMKAEWDKWRADTTMHQRAIAAAKTAFSNATGPAEASLTQPGQPPFDAEQFQGDLISKDVTVNAQVEAPGGGAMTEKTLVITLQRVSGTMAGQPREGRWIITRIQGA
jgi:hypothetical protein